MILCRRITLFGGFKVPTDSTYLVHFDAEAFIVTSCEQPLCFSNSKFSRLFPICQPAVKVPANIRPAALVGAYGYNTYGGAFLHHDTGSGWNQTILKADDRTVGDYFGASVAIDNGRAAIAATRDCDDGNRSGSVSEFRPRIMS